MRPLPAAMLLGLARAMDRPSISHQPSAAQRSLGCVTQRACPQRCLVRSGWQAHWSRHPIAGVYPLGTADRSLRGRLGSGYPDEHRRDASSAVLLDPPTELHRRERSVVAVKLRLGGLLCRGGGGGNKRRWRGCRGLLGGAGPGHRRRRRSATGQHSRAGYHYDANCQAEARCGIGHLSNSQAFVRVIAPIRIGPPASIDQRIRKPDRGDWSAPNWRMAIGWLSYWSSSGLSPRCRTA
jgi:hypothetical protein